MNNQQYPQIYLLISLWAICILLLGLMIPGQSQAKTQDELYNYYQQNSQAIVKKLEDYHLLRSQKKSNSGHAAFAWAELATILHYIPNHPLALERLGALSIVLDRKEQAAAYFEKAIQLFKNDDKTLALYADFLNQYHDHSNAKEIAQRALKIAPSNTQALNQLGLAYFGLKDVSNATLVADKVNHLGALSKELRDALKSST